MDRKKNICLGLLIYPLQQMFLNVEKGCIRKLVVSQAVWSIF